MVFSVFKTAHPPRYRQIPDGRGLLPLIAAGFLLVFSSEPTGAAEPTSRAVKSTAEPVQVAASRCVRLIRRQTREFLVNTCGNCRVVKVRRTRRGNDFPSMRTYTVQERSDFDLSFKGPGRTRIMSDLPCGGEDSTLANAPQCVHLMVPRGRPAVLYNNCTSCRAVSVETRATAGSPARQTYTLKGKTYIRTPWLKPPASRVVSDTPCG